MVIVSLVSRGIWRYVLNVAPGAAWYVYRTGLSVPVAATNRLISRGRYVVRARRCLSG